MRISPLGRLVLTLALVSSSACYGYEPVAAPVPVDAEVRARLTQATALAESELLGTVTQEYQGRVAEVTEDSLMISVVAARAIGTVTTRSIRRTVRLPLSGIEEISQRSLSGTRTALAIGAAGALMVAVVRAFGPGGGGLETEPPGEPTFRPGLRFSWPF